MLLKNGYNIVSEKASWSASLASEKNSHSLFLASG